MRYLIFFLLLAISACHSGNQDSKNGLLTLKTIHEGVVLRETPSEQGRELCVLQGGAKLTEAGEVSRFIAEIRFNDAPVQSPWIKVKTKKGEQGWVFGGSVQPEKANVDAWRIQQLSHCFFGKTLTERAQALQASIGKSTIQSNYKTAMALRDTMMAEMARLPAPNATRPEFSWLPKVLPGFVFQWVANGKQAYLFADYRYWLQQSQQSGNQVDAAFMSLCCTAFPTDSIESFFPRWKIQISDDVSYSQLGSGQHLDFLRRLNQIWDQGKEASPYQSEMIRFKDALLDDIAGKNIRYWQPKEKIVKELIDIINAGFWCFSPEDMAVLKERLGMMSAAEKNGIYVNMRSGKAG